MGPLERSYVIFSQADGMIEPNEEVIYRKVVWWEAPEGKAGHREDLRA